jgi:hypothetical protein
VINDQLTLAIEEIGKKFLSSGRIEYVILFDLYPWELAALGRDGIAFMSELFLFR